MSKSPLRRVLCQDRGQLDCGEGGGAGGDGGSEWGGAVDYSREKTRGNS